MRDVYKRQIWVRALQLRKLFFRLAEAVPEPAHHESGFKCQGFVLPYIRHRVAVDPDSAFLVCSAVRCIVFIPVSYTHLDVYKRQTL